MKRSLPIILAMLVLSISFAFAQLNIVISPKDGRGSAAWGASQLPAGALTLFSVEGIYQNGDGDLFFVAPLEISQDEQWAGLSQAAELSTDEGFNDLILELNSRANSPDDVRALLSPAHLNAGLTMIQAVNALMDDGGLSDEDMEWLTNFIRWLNERF